MMDITTAGTAGDRELSERKVAKSNKFEEFSSDRRIAWALRRNSASWLVSPLLYRRKS